MSKLERIEQDVVHRRAQVAVLSGLARGDGVYDLVPAAAPSHVPGWFTSGVALLELAVTALDSPVRPAPSRWSTRACASTTCPR